jgi:hypothetical protein
MRHSDKQVYLDGILHDIELLRGRKVRTLARARVELSPEVAGHVRNYFEGKPGYELQLRKCARCKSQYDLVIMFPL